MTAVLGSQAVHGIGESLGSLHAPSPVVRRIAVASLEPGSGSTTIARLLARTLARHRGGRIVLVDHPHETDSCAHLSEPTTDQRASLPSVFDGDVRPWQGVWRAARAVDDRWFDASVTDVGHLPEPMYALEALADASAVCLVSSMDRRRGEQAIALAAALAAHPEGAPAFVAFVARERSRSTWPRLVCERHPLASTVVPFDRTLALGVDEEPGAATRAAVLRIAGDAMTAATAETNA